MIRLATKEDIPFVLDLSLECFPGFDVEASRKWLESRIEVAGFFLVVGDGAAALAYVTTAFWEPNSPKFLIDFIACRKTRFGAANVLNILKFLNELRKEKKYDKTYVRAALADMTPFIKKLGGTLFSQTWVIED